MEDYPQQAYALLTVVAVEEFAVVIADADGTRYRTRCIPRRTNPDVKQLRPGDVLIVNHVHPVDGLTVVERLTTLGKRDGSQYELFDRALAAKSEPA